VSNAFAISLPKSPPHPFQRGGVGEKIEFINDLDKFAICLNRKKMNRTR